MYLFFIFQTLQSSPLSDSSAPSGATKGFRKFLFPPNAVVLWKTCNQTLMCKISGYLLQAYGTFICRTEIEELNKTNYKHHASLEP